MILSTAVATLKKRLAYATGARDAWQGSGERLKYVAACARLDMLRAQLEKLARAVRRAPPPDPR
jgi:hypothetical protein